MMLPIEVPAMRSMGMPARSNTLSTPMWAMPLAPPPASTMPTRLRTAGRLSATSAESPTANVSCPATCALVPIVTESSRKTVIAKNFTHPIFLFMAIIICFTLQILEK